MSEGDVRSTRRVVEDDVQGDVVPDHEWSWGTLPWLRITEGRCSPNAAVHGRTDNGHDRTGPPATIHRPSLGITPTGLDTASRSAASQAPDGRIPEHPAVPSHFRRPLAR